MVHCSVCGYPLDIEPTGSLPVLFCDQCAPVAQVIDLTDREPEAAPAVPSLSLS